MVQAEADEIKLKNLEGFHKMSPDRLLSRPPSKMDERSGKLAVETLI